MLDLMQQNLFQSDEPAPVVGTAFAEIVFDRPLDHAYTYAIPPGCKTQVAVGKRVLAPFGRGDKQTIGFCVGMTEVKPERKVKAIVQVLDDEPMLTDHLLKLTRWMADYYLCGWGQVLNVVVPAGVKKQAGTRMVPMLELVASTLPDPLPHLSPKQKKVLEYLQTHPAPVEVREVMEATGCGGMPIEALVEKGYARRFAGASIKRRRCRNRRTWPKTPPSPPAPLPEYRERGEGPILTPDQAAAWAKLEPALSRQADFNHFSCTASPAAARPNSTSAPSRKSCARARKRWSSFPKSA